MATLSFEITAADLAKVLDKTITVERALRLMSRHQLLPAGRLLRSAASIKIAAADTADVLRALS